MIQVLIIILEILFLNWEAINKKDKNLLILENEKEFYLGKVLENTKNNGNKLKLRKGESSKIFLFL